jgi:hypothetical protein
VCGRFTIRISEEASDGDGDFPTEAHLNNINGIAKLYCLE